MGPPQSLNPMVVGAVITNCSRRKTTRVNSPLPEDAIRRLPCIISFCMHGSVGGGGDAVVFLEIAAEGAVFIETGAETDLLGG